MNNQMPELIIPRNEKELCEIFEVLLFMDTEKFPYFEQEKSDDKYKMNKEDISLLNKTGALNRIFRRWPDNQ